MTELPAAQPDPLLTAPVRGLSADAVGAVAVGTVVWAVLLVACLIDLDGLRRGGHLWWLATCITGVVLGFLGLLVTVRRRRRIAHAAA